MLETDLVLIHGREFRPVVNEYYKNEVCERAYARGWLTDCLAH